MRRFGQKMISLLLVAVFLAGMFPASALADNSQGDIYVDDAAVVEGGVTPLPLDGEDPGLETGDDSGVAGDSALDPAFGNETSPENDSSDGESLNNVGEQDESTDPPGIPEEPEGTDGVPEEPEGADGGPEEPVEPEDGADGPTGSEGDITLQSLIDDAAAEANGEAFTVRLDKDWTENINVYDGYKLTLDLNGHSISPVREAGDSRTVDMITVYGELTLTGGDLIGSGDGNTRAVNVTSNAVFTLESGGIHGFSVEGNGAAVQVENHGTFIMNGGEVYGNTASEYGGGVYAYDASSAHLVDGTIRDNSAPYGGGVAFNTVPYAPSDCIVNTTIKCNTATEQGGGLYIEAFGSVESGIMIRGLLSENTAPYGGGVYTSQAMTLLVVGYIENNSAAKRGGGVYINGADSVLSIPGGTLRGNRVESTGDYGGGAFLNNRTHLILTDDGIITENYAYRRGGGFYLASGTNTSKRSTIQIGVMNEDGTTSSPGHITKNSVELENPAVYDLYGAGFYAADYIEFNFYNGELSENTGLYCGGGAYLGNYILMNMYEGAYICNNTLTTVNRSGNGVGIYIYHNSTVNLYGGEISGNRGIGYNVRWAGAAFANTNTTNMYGHFTVRDNETSACDANSNGGGGLYATNLNMYDESLITGNWSSSNGGGAQGTTLHMYDYSVISGNTARSSGGGASFTNVYLHDNARIAGNRAENGSAGGGGVYCTSFYLHDNASVDSNYSSNYGGGVFVCTNINMDGGSVTNNEAAGAGGGICVRRDGGVNGSAGMTAEISGGVIANNTAAATGGGVWIGGWNNDDINQHLTISGGSITGNYAGTTGRWNGGGGVWAALGSTLTVTGGVITGNSSNRVGGGVGNSGDSTLIITGGEIRDNDAVYEGKDVFLRNIHSANDYWMRNFPGRGTLALAEAKDMRPGGENVCWYDDANGEYVDELPDFASIIQTWEDEDIASYNPSATGYPYKPTIKTQEGCWGYTYKYGKAVCSIDGQAYASVAEAVAAIVRGDKPDGSVIVLIVDVQEDVVIPEGVTATLDLAGYTLRGEKNSTIYIESGAELTIDDSRGGGTITGGHGTPRPSSATATNWDTYGGNLYIAGTLTLKAGTITGGYNAPYENSTSLHGLYGSSAYVADGGRFYMTGGAITGNAPYGTNQYYSAAVYVCNSGEPQHPVTLGGALFEMTGGEISGNNCYGIYSRCGGTWSVATESFSGNVIHIGGDAVISGNSYAGISSDGASSVTVDGNARIVDNKGWGLNLPSGTTTLIAGNAEISGNRGGVVVAGGYYTTVTVTDSVVITGNRSGDSGAGIRFNTSGGKGKCLTITPGAQVYGNESDVQGSDIYVSGAGVYLDLEDAQDMGLGHVCWHEDYYGDDYEHPQGTEKPIGVLDENTGLYKTDKAVYLTASMTLRADGVAYILASDVPEEMRESFPRSELGSDDSYGDYYTYYTLTAAVNAAKTAGKDAVIYLMKNEVEGNATINRREEITLDLNGYTLFTDKAKGFNVIGGGLTIRDTGDSLFHGPGVGTIAPAEEITDGRAIYMSNSNTNSAANPWCEPYVTLEGGTITGYSTSESGAAVYANSGTVTVRDGVVIRDNTAYTYGGGVYMDRGNWTAANSLAKEYGGYSFIMTGGLFEGNSAGGYGGGVCIWHSSINTGKQREVSITGGVFRGNATTRSIGESYGGGGVYIGNNSNTDATYYTTRIENVLFEDNTTVGYGGGIWAGRVGGRYSMDNVTARNNTAATAGGIFVRDYSNYVDEATRIELSNLTVTGNTATGGNGGMRICGSVYMHDCVITGNTAQSGGSGGICYFDNYYRNVTRFENVTISGNRSFDGASGLYIEALSSLASYWPLNSHPGEEKTSITLDRVSVTDNVAAMNYSGVQVGPFGKQNVLTIQNSEIANNTAERGCYAGLFIGYSGWGDATIYHSGKITIRDTKIHDNKCETYGAGMWTSTSSNNLNDTTRTRQIYLESGVEVYNNTSGTWGAGVQAGGGYTLHIADGVRIHDNTAGTYGAGLYTSNAYIYATGGVIENNVAGTSHAGLAFMRNHELRMDGVTIRNNIARSGNGGGVSINQGEISSMLPRVITNTLITGNYASNNGGGVYIWSDNYEDQGWRSTLVIGEGTVITGNTAGSFGGGVYQSGVYSTAFELAEGGRIYGNSASLGQDVYACARYNNRSVAKVDLINAESMFDGDATKRGLGWLDELTNDVITIGVHSKNLARSYPLTLEYAQTEEVVAVVTDGGDTYEFYTVQDAVDYASAHGIDTAYMVRDSHENLSVPSGMNVTLDLNGYTLSGLTTAITNYGNLRIADGKTDFTATVSPEGLSVRNDYTAGEGTGTITGNSATSGGGIYVRGGTVTMTAGQITGCTANESDQGAAHGGAAVAIEAGTFTFAGGSINNNWCIRGAAVLVKNSAGRFVMTGGEITENHGFRKRDHYAGTGVIQNNNGRVSITGGRITDNEAWRGGAIYNSGGTTAISGLNDGDGKVLIANNNVNGWYNGNPNSFNNIGGGAIWLASGEVRLTNVQLSGNSVLGPRTATHWERGGGAVFVDGGRLTIDEGTTFRSNSAVRGGAIYVCGAATVFMLGGSIAGNVAQMGGGVAMWPENQNVFNLMGGAIFGNRATLTAGGNDVYSRYEGTGNYSTFKAKPQFTTIPASEMGRTYYNTWRDDQYNGYTDQNGVYHFNRSGEELYNYKAESNDGNGGVSGEYVTGRINNSNNLMLTASHYNVTVEDTAANNDLYISYFDLSDVDKGTNPQVTGSGFDRIAGDDTPEYTALEILNLLATDPEAAAALGITEAHETTETYYQNTGTTYSATISTVPVVDENGNSGSETITEERPLYYISVTKNGEEKLYERDQMVTWQPGDDFSATNSLIRSYDQITYITSTTVALDETAAYAGLDEAAIRQAAIEAAIAAGKPDGGVYTDEELAQVADNAVQLAKKEITDRDRVYRLWEEIILPADAMVAGFNAKTWAGMKGYNVIPAVDENGNDIQILRGFWEVETKSGRTETHMVYIDILGMTNGQTIKPSIRQWVEGSERDAANDKLTAYSDTITVSTTGRYNVTLKPNTALAATGYYNAKEGSAATEAEYNAAIEADPTQEDIIFGTMLGYGITLELMNESGKGLKGLEAPADGLEFSILMDGSLYIGGEPVLDSEGNPVVAPPYLWAYKENETGTLGRAFGRSAYTVNMDWNDGDDLVKTTSYAYDAAPFNIGNDAKSCFSGGGWTITSADRGEENIELRFRVSGYALNNNSNPTQNSNGTTDPTLSAANVKAFSAGYVQMLFPFPVEVTKSQTGYLSIFMQTAICREDIISASGQTAVSDLTDEDDLAPMIAYFGSLEEAQRNLSGEVKYFDNWSNIQSSLYVYNLEGWDIAYGDYIESDSYFLNQGGTALAGSGGTSMQPLGGKVWTGTTVVFSGQAYRSDVGELPDPDDVDAVHQYRNNYMYYVPDEELDLQLDDPTRNEYNYMTAANVLQKFDADVFTPAVGLTTSIVKEQYNISTQVNSLAVGNTSNISGNDKSTVRIQTNEMQANWFNTSNADWKNRPFRYQLTILYAAKPDGSNWIKIAKDDNETDGGTADMDMYREENLLYFTTLQSLYDYFGYDAEGEPLGKCVGILYEFRNMCLRGHGDQPGTLDVRMLMNVTDDFDYTGHTYCFTEDTRTWSTYRKEYKMALRDGRLNDILYGWNYVDQARGDGSYGLALETGEYVFRLGDHQLPTHEDVYGYNTMALNGREAVSMITGRAERFYPGVGVTANGYLCRYGYKSTGVESSFDYIKTEYEFGWQRTGTHNGWRKGNSILLYTLDSSIILNKTDYQEGGNATKTTYDISKGERVAHFRITPSVSESTSIRALLDRDNNALNSKQSTRVDITLTIPAYMTLEDGSIQFDYSPDKDSNGRDIPENVQPLFHEEDLEWTIGRLESYVDPDTGETKTRVVTSEPVLNEDGTYTIVFSTAVADVNKRLPKIDFAAMIGDPRDVSKDPRNGAVLTVTAEITATYEEHNQLAANTKLDKESLQVVFEPSDGMYMIARERLNDLGDDLTYDLVYFNTSETAISDSIVLSSVLPYNGDNRGSSFHGGYRVKELTLQFTGDAEEAAKALEEFLKTVDGETAGFLSYADGVKAPVSSSTSYDADVQSLYGNLDDGAAKMSYTVDTETNTITFQLTAEQQTALTTLATDESGKALFCKLPYLGKNSSAMLTYTLSPLEDTSGEVFIEDSAFDAEKKQQIGGDTYYADAFYKYANSNAYVKTAPQQTKIIKRVLGGFVFIDNDRDGKYSAADADKNRTVKGVEVTLYQADENGEFLLDANDNYIQAVNTLGQVIPTAVTGINGQYEFENLPEGNFRVVFTDENDDWIDSTTGKHIISFSDLAVSELTKYGKEHAFASRAVANYSTSNGLGSAESWTWISMPSTESIKVDEYRVANWNLGLFYSELSLVKTWTDMVTRVPEGTTVNFSIVGFYDANGNGVQDETEPELRKYPVVMTQGSDVSSVTVKMRRGDEGVEEDVLASDRRIEPASFTHKRALSPEGDKLPIYTWTLTKLRLPAVVLVWDSVNGLQVRELTYRFTETAREADGSEVTGFSTTTRIDYDSWTGERTFSAENRRLLGDFTFTKVDSVDASKTLKNAMFCLYSDEACTTPILFTGSAGSYTRYFDGNNTNGTTEKLSVNNRGELSFRNLADGTYYLREIKAPSGYHRAKTTWRITLTHELTGEYAVTALTKWDVVNEQAGGAYILKRNTDSSKNSMKIYYNEETDGYQLPNRKSIAAPFTGGAGVRVILGMGITLTLASVAAYLLQQRKKKQKA